MKKDNQIISLQEKIIQEFIEKRRPSENVRDKLDIGYSFENQVYVGRPLPNP